MNFLYLIIISINIQFINTYELFFKIYNEFFIFNNY